MAAGSSVDGEVAAVGMETPSWVRRSRYLANLSKLPLRLAILSFWKSVSTSSSSSLESARRVALSLLMATSTSSMGETGSSSRTTNVRCFAVVFDNNTLSGIETKSCELHVPKSSDVGSMAKFATLRTFALSTMAWSLSWSAMFSTSRRS